MALLDVVNLHVKIPTTSGVIHAIRGIDLRVEKGETVGLVGESGCGKSLTSLALMGLLPRGTERTAKRLALEGRDLTLMKERQLADIRGTEMAMIFQEPMTSLNPSLTIGEQLSEVYRRHCAEDRKQANSRAIALLDRVGISNASIRMNHYPHQLSGGLRQRVMIAMALMCKSKLLIADEPTTALDVTIQAQILRLLVDLQSELDMGLIFITHDLGVVARIADRVCVMYAGKIVESAPTRELFENPQHPYTQGLLSCVPVPGANSAGGRLHAIPGSVPNLASLASEGCAYASRCTFAVDECKTATPASRTMNQGHSVRCIKAPFSTVIKRTAEEASNV